MIIMVLGLAACGQPKTASEAPVNSEPVQIANPWHDITEAEAKAICPKSFAVPEEAEDAVWSVMDQSDTQSALVQLSFNLYGMDFTAREQVTGNEDADISGMYYEWTAHMDEPLRNWPDAVCHSYRWIGEDGYADLCTWYDTSAGISYSLSVTSEDLDGFDLTAVVESIAEEGSIPKTEAIDPDDYIGYYTNGSYDEVIIDRNGDDYTMTVSLYRLTYLDEGTVSFTEEGVFFNTIDASGKPMIISFSDKGDGTYSLRIEESTWLYLEPGMVFDNMIKTTREAAYPDL